MNYKTASDFELNKRLAELLGKKIGARHVDDTFVRVSDANWYWYRLDYCNSWADMGPVFLILYQKS